MKKSIFTEIWKISHDKLPLHPQFNHYMHYTFLIQDNKIVEWATNKSFEPPLHWGYHARIQNKDFKPKLHSEIECYRKAKGILQKNRPFDIINIRLNRHGEIRNSKPCVCCTNLLYELGCRNIYYFHTEEDIIKV